MPAYGYARVSLVDQKLAIQREALERAGCVTIRVGKVSGTSTQGSMGLRTLLDFIREGDELVITCVDRLVRSIGDLQDVVRELKGKGATLLAINNRSTHLRPPARRFSICWGCSRSSRPTFGASGRWKGWPRRKVSVRGRGVNSGAIAGGAGGYWVHRVRWSC